MTGDEQQVWDAMRAVYQAFLAGDPAAVDALLHPGVTIWDSAEPQLAIGLDALQELRTRRPADGTAPTVAALVATDPVVTVWGDIALLRHLLTVTFAEPGQAAESVRNTSVWRRVDGRWLAVHNHEDVLAQ